MPRQSKTAAASGKAALPQLSKQMLEELIPGPVTKEQFTLETAVEPTEKLKKPNIHAGFQRLRVTAEQFQMGESGKHGNSMRDRHLLEFWGFNCRK
ncbi:hypothetical protein PY257_09645 [Ramlibacter sp. H39-3-26]|uniref:hypothetical protein n=1 Tax=Curvibacter soli TaxID=3031331 RepID=UPI0023DC64EB|nr:hypothetical protein [Ramlibacter sp. H39-3-26]MDF1485436.1 hypothetical protein [Ramlibacter sp. H39-3-26]